MRRGRPPESGLSSRSACPANARFAHRRIVRRAGAPAYYAGVIRVRMTVSDLARTRFAYSGCITGSYQPTIVDGFFMMVKPLAPGFHTIVVHGTNTLGDDRTYNYRLTVTG
jgi:hypothetical protein